MQSKISQHPRNQENGTHSLHKRKSIEFNPKTNQMLELTDKDLKAVTITLLIVFIAWNMFSMHNNLCRDRRRLSWEIMTIKKSVVCRYEMLIPSRINTNNPTSRDIIVKTVESQWERPREKWRSTYRGTTIQLTPLLIRNCRVLKKMEQSL